MADLTTLPRVKTFLSIAHTQFDPLLEDIIAAASGAIRDYCARQFAAPPGEYSEYHDGGTDTLVLRERPVTEVSAIYEDSGHQWPESSKLDSKDFIVNEEAGLVTRAWGTFPSGRAAVKIIYTAGYTTIPEAVAQACVLVCVSWFRRAREGARPMGSPPRLAPYPEEIQPVAGELLQPYRDFVA